MWRVPLASDIQGMTHRPRPPSSLPEEGPTIKANLPIVKVSFSKKTSVMIFSIPFIAALISGAQALVTRDVRTTNTDVCGNTTAAVPFYQLYHTKGDHFYTTNINERNTFIVSSGYLDQGVVGYIFSSPQPSTIPLYRAYQSNRFDHFYTTNLPERDLAIRGLGYVAQGVAGYVYPDDLCGPGPLPLYRSFNQAMWDHFYTMSEVEKEDAVTKGYYEGVAGYSVLS